MDSIREQMDLTNEISDAISNPVGMGNMVDEVSCGVAVLSNSGLRFRHRCLSRTSASFGRVPPPPWRKTIGIWMAVEGTPFADSRLCRLQPYLILPSTAVAGQRFRPDPNSRNETANKAEL